MFVILKILYYIGFYFKIFSFFGVRWVFLFLVLFLGVDFFEDFRVRFLIFLVIDVGFNVEVLGLLKNFFIVLVLRRNDCNSDVLCFLLSIYVFIYLYILLFIIWI